ncbi:hypothetical protein RHMOL_Rhmol01G0084400 [Rhododendron molle]|uniref:Uncharacterized protein n=1 Tax=Rhododendron molle TaxID=49168 RepID=A0ACC0Q167_RHOML|nr:hypothetical protein RHMOL_Rhmol01G0084400 [Rhododendron molle]
MACDILVGSSSSSSSAQLVSPNLSPEEAEDKEKQNLVCIIIVVADAYHHDKFNWYAFDVSDDPNHNQPRPSSHDIPLPPALSPLYTRLPDHLLPFHHDDVYGPVEQIKPTATRCTDIGRGWVILGTENNKQQQLDTMLLRIRKEKLGNSVECINLGSCSGDGAGINGTEWKRVADLPTPVSRSPTCLVLRGKLYCLSGFTQLARQYEGGCDGVANKFCLSWVSHLPPCPKTEEEIEEEDDCLKEEDEDDDDCISRLHRLKVRVVIGDNATPQTGIFHLEVSIISCQSYSVDGTKLFCGAMLVPAIFFPRFLFFLVNLDLRFNYSRDGNLGCKSSKTSPPSMDD